MHRASLAPCPAAFASGRRPPPVVRLVLLHRGTAASSWQQIVAAPGGSANSQPRTAPNSQIRARAAGGSSLSKPWARCCPAIGAWRRAQYQRVCATAPREPSKNTGRRTRCRALEACGGSAELSLRRPLGALLPVSASLLPRIWCYCTLQAQPLGKNSTRHCPSESGQQRSRRGQPLRQ